MRMRRLDCGVQVRMANLAIVGSYKVNGVAAIHADIVKADVFPHFVEYYKKKGITDKFIGITNGVTCRRWMAQCNPTLSALISKCLGSDKWVRDLDLLQGLKKFVDDDKVSTSRVVKMNLGPLACRCCCTCTCCRVSSFLMA